MNENKVHISTRLTLSVVAACLVSFCGLLTETAVNIAFPAIMSDFHVSTQTVQWLTTGNLLTIAMITPLSAFLQRRFRIKSLFVFSALCFLVGSLCAFFAPTFSVLLLGRIIHGIATGVGVPLAFCIMLEQVPYQKVGTFIGFGALVSAAAPALGPTYGGVITTAFGWRSVFSILIPLLIFTLVLGIITIREHSEPKKVPIDMGGIVMIMATFFCLVYAFANLGAFATAPVSEILFFAVGVILFVIFGRQLTPALIIVFYIIFGSGCGIAFGNTMTTALMRLPVEVKSYGNTALNTLMQFAGAVGTSVCAACVAFSQAGVNASDTAVYADATKKGSFFGFVFLLVLTVVCILLQIYGFRRFEKEKREDR